MSSAPESCEFSPSFAAFVPSRQSILSFDKITSQTIIVLLVGRSIDFLFSLIVQFWTYNTLIMVTLCFTSDNL